MLTGVAGVVAGAASMAVGEYVSVSSQRDAERADLVALERQLQAGAASKVGPQADGIAAGVELTLVRRISWKRDGGNLSSASNLQHGCQPYRPLLRER